MKVPNLILVPLTDEYREFPTPLIRYCTQYFMKLTSLFCDE